MNSAVSNVNIYLKKSANGFLIDNDKEFFVGIFVKRDWDLVDDGKHLDWDSDTKYISSVQSGVNLCEGHRSGVIRPDSIFVVQDVFISDYYEVSTTMGYTSSNGTIKLNDYHFEDMTSAQRIKTATHELGHALGLDYTTGTNDIMKQGKLSITSLS